MMAGRQVIQSDDVSCTSSTKFIFADNFPSKAFLVIEQCDSNDPAVACWSDNGTYFVVKDTAAFAASYLPQYFKHSNFQSFVRQLNLYGFRTVRDKQDASQNDGPAPVLFEHEYFQRGRGDLLKHIKRSKKNNSKKSRDQESETSKEECFNRRFDEMQQQMDELSQKLDLVLSLLSAKSDSERPSEYVPRFSPVMGSKRRRYDTDDERAESSDSVTDRTSDSVTDDTSSRNSSVASSPAASPVLVRPRHEHNMEVLEEHEEYPSNERDSGLEEAQSHLKVPHEKLGTAGDDLQEFIDMMLHQDNQVDGDRRGDMELSGHSLACHSFESFDGSVANPNFVADAVTSKDNPAPVEAVHQKPLSFATAVTTSGQAEEDVNEEYDEEAGAYDNSPPITTAVHVVDASLAEGRFRGWIGKRIWVVVFCVLVIVSFVVWPVVVFGDKDSDDDEETRSRRPPIIPPPEERPPFDRPEEIVPLGPKPEGTDFAFPGNISLEGIVSNINSRRNETLENNRHVPLGVIGDADSQPDVNPDVLTVNWNGKEYQCKAMP